AAPTQSLDQPITWDGFGLVLNLYRHGLSLCNGQLPLGRCRWSVRSKTGQRTRNNCCASTPMKLSSQVKLSQIRNRGLRRANRGSRSEERGSKAVSRSLFHPRSSILDPRSSLGRGRWTNHHGSVAVRPVAEATVGGPSGAWRQDDRGAQVADGP